MMISESLLSIRKEDLPEVAKAMDSSELSGLVDLLPEKDDKIRYQAFLLLQYRSQLLGDVYPFWETFRTKLNDANSYQRSIGIMLIAENAKWDVENKMVDVIRKNFENDNMDNFILDSLSGGILDKKAIKQIQTFL